MQSGGAGLDFGSMSFSGEGTKQRVADNAHAEKVKAEYQQEKKTKELRASLEKANADEEIKKKTDANTATKTATDKDIADKIAKRKGMSRMEKLKADYSGKGSLKSKAGSSLAHSAIGSKGKIASTYKDLKKASREKDESKIIPLGPYALALSYILANTKSN